jgi:hypothetical protein
MNDYRAARQELQDQVAAVARKGQQRVTSTVKTVTATAQHIRPQLASLPKPTLNISALPGQAQLREMGPALYAKLPNSVQTKLPTPDQMKASAQGLADQARAVQRRVLEQVRTAATPIAHQAAERLSQFGAPATKPAPSIKSETTTRVSEVTVTKGDKPKPTTTRTRPSASRGSAASQRKPGSTSTDT